MKLKSLILNHNRLEIAEVEIEFIPGIPQIHFLGLPDRIIKESFYRIKSALKNAGYKFPMTSQVIVNIKPSHLRKSSRGLELAVALGILLRSEQISEELINKDWIIYGELGLDGKIYEPTDLTNEVNHFKSEKFLTGLPQNKESQNAKNILRLENLKKIEIDQNQNTDFTSTYQRPTFGFFQKYSKEEAEFIFLTVTSGLHGLLAGDSGAGKSTLAKAISCFAKEPNEDENIRFEQKWRPFVNPHQSISPAAFLGGGAYLHEGEIERAQGGYLFLDEFLEFEPEILESLRGPMTGETLRLSRGAFYREIKPDFQVIATSNLCPCGKWTPQKTNGGCRFSRTKCTKYLERFSGPLLDRFSILLFVEKAPKRHIEALDILKRIQDILRHLKQAEFEKSEGLIEKYYENLSTRRRNYLDRVAQLYALEHALQTNKSLNLHDKITVKLSFHDYDLAERWVIKPFEQLEKGMS
jgi:magnesium chelatase family protein